MEEALNAGVERIVYTSSVATLKITDGVSSTGTIRLRMARGSVPISAARLPPSVWSRR